MARPAVRRRELRPVSRALASSLASTIDATGEEANRRRLADLERLFDGGQRCDSCCPRSNCTDASEVSLRAARSAFFAARSAAAPSSKIRTASERRPSYSARSPSPRPTTIVRGRSAPPAVGRWPPRRAVVLAPTARRPSRSSINPSAVPAIAPPAPPQGNHRRTRNRPSDCRGTKPAWRESARPAALHRPPRSSAAISTDSLRDCCAPPRRRGTARSARRIRLTHCSRSPVDRKYSPRTANRSRAVMPSRWRSASLLYFSASSSRPRFRDIADMP